MILDRLLLYISLAIIVLLGGYSGVSYFEKKSLKTKVQNGEDAIVAYESLLKTKPFEAKHQERKEATNAKTKKKIYTTIIADGNYTWK